MYEEDVYWRDRDQHENTNITYYTPTMAWVVFGMVQAALVVFSFIYPETTMTVGNSSLTLSIIPISTALFALFGVLSLRKSVHFSFFCYWPTPYSI